MSSRWVWLPLCCPIRLTLRAGWATAKYPRPMRLLGIPVSDDDARHLIATLVVEGTPDALTAAAQITKGVERGR